MKRLHLLKTVLLLCALIVGSGTMWGDTVTLTSAQIKAGTGSTSYGACTATDGSKNTWNAYAIKNQHSNATSDYHFWQIKKYASSTAYYVQVPTLGSKITQLVITVSGSNKPMDGGDNSATLFFSASNSTSATGTGVASGTGASSVTIDCSSLNLNTGYITASGAVRIWDVTVTYTSAVSLEAPTFSLAEGEVTKGTKVTLTQAAADEIRYTLDGTDPTKTTGTVYSDPIEINTATTIKAIAVKGDEVSDVAEASYTVSYPKVVTLDFTDADWGFPTEYNTSEKSYTNNGYTITLGESSNGHKNYIVSENIVSLIWGKKDATLILPAFGFNVSKLKVYGYSSASGNVTFNVYVGEDAVSTEVTSSKVTQEFIIAAEKQEVGTIYTIKVTNANNCQISKIEVYGNGCEAGLVGNAGWATYVTEAPVTYADGDAFAVTSVGSSVELTSVTSVPTGTPLLLKGAGHKTAILLEDEPAAITNKLEISDGDDGVNDYVLANHNSKVGFYKWTGSHLASGKVYLPASAIPSGSREFIGFEDETTGISNVNSEVKTLFNGDFYNLSGQRVAKPTKGLYIVNGKKVIIK